MKKNKTQASKARTETVEHTDQVKPHQQNEDAPKAEHVQRNDRLLKISFWSSLLLMLLYLWISGYDSGFHSDEMDMNVYGKANIAYYTSGGKDTGFMHPSHHDGTSLPVVMRLYGTAFEYLAGGLTYLLGDDYEYNTRHALNQLFAVLGLLFTGLIAKRLNGGYKTALLSIWLIFLTPIFSGLAIFNTKDIPFLTAYMASLYCTIRFFEELPKPSWRSTLFLCLSISFLLSIRIGGLLLFGYIALYTGMLYLRQKDKLLSDKSWLLQLALALGGSLVLTVLAWPYVLQNPLDHLMEAVSAAKNFPQRIPFTFEGEPVTSLDLPGNYLLKAMLITIPVICLIILAGGIILLLTNSRKATNKPLILLLLIAGIFPVFYAIATRMALYNSWRHLLFAYPCLVLSASAGLHLFTEQFNKKNISLAIYGIIAIGMIRPTLWSVKNSSYQYTYYNEFAGGFTKAYYEYETDYWQISAKEAADWLMQHESLENRPDTVLIGSNAYTFCNYYVKKRYPKAKARFINVGEKANFAAPITYGIFNTLFLEPSYLENCYPSPLRIHTIDIDDKVVCYVKKDTAQLLYRGINKIQEQDFVAADSLFSLYKQQIGYDGSLKNMNLGFSYIALAGLAVNHFDAAYGIAQKFITLFPNDYMGNFSLGLLHLQYTKDYRQAQYYLNIAHNLNPQEPGPVHYLNMLKTQQR